MSPVRNVSPGEKIVIKKSEIKFKPSSNSLKGYDLNIDKNRESVSSPGMDSNDLLSNKNSVDILSQGKQLAFDFIKNMLGVN